MIRWPFAPARLTLERVDENRLAMLSVGGMTEADLQSAHPDDQVLMETWSEFGPVIVMREVAKVGIVHVEDDVDHEDLEAMQPYLQEAVRLMESGAYDYVVMGIGGRKMNASSANWGGVEPGA